MATIEQIRAAERAAEEVRFRISLYRGLVETSGPMPYRDPAVCASVFSLRFARLDLARALEPLLKDDHDEAERLYSYANGDLAPVAIGGAA